MSNNKMLNVKSLKEMFCIIPGVMYAEKIQESTDYSCEIHRLYYTEKAYKEIKNLLNYSSLNPSYNNDYVTVSVLRYKVKEDTDGMLYAGGIIYGVEKFKTYIDKRLNILKENNPKTSWRSVINFVDYSSILDFNPSHVDCERIEFDKNILINRSKAIIIGYGRMYKCVFDNSYFNVNNTLFASLNVDGGDKEFSIKESEFKNVVLSSHFPTSHNFEYVRYGNVEKDKRCIIRDSYSNIGIDLCIHNSLIIDSELSIFKILNIIESTIKDCVISGISRISKSILQGLEVVSVSFDSKRVIHPRLHLARYDSKNDNRYYSGHGVIGLEHDSIQVVNYDDQISMATVIGDNRTVVNGIEDLTLDLLDNPNTNLTLYNTDPNRLSINKRFKDFIKYVLNKITL